MPKAVYKSGDKEYVIRSEDRIWLARMVYGEAGKSPSLVEMQAVLWAIMNRFMLVPKQRESRSIMVDLVRAFSQPVNPRWDGIEDDEEEGDFCVFGGKYFGTKHCSADKLARRRLVSSMAWKDIPVKIREAVLAFEQGNLAYPKRAGSQRITNWASYENVEKKFPWGIDIGGNWFFEDRSTLDLPVVALGGLGGGTGKIVGMLALGGLASYLGYWLAGKV